MVTIERKAAWLLAGLIAASSVQAQALRRERVPGEIPAAQVWQDVLAHDELATVANAYVPLAELHDETGNFKPGACAGQAQALAQSLVDNPVSLALWDAGYRCAEAMGDEALAEKRLGALQALLEHAMTSKPPDGRRTPIRVVMEIDAFTLVEATGGTPIYSYYELSSLPRTMPLVIGVEDRDGERETMFAFDFLDTMVTLGGRAEPRAVYPDFRRGLGLQLLKMIDEATPASTAGEALAGARAGALPASERLAAFQGLAAAGNFSAIMQFGRYCLVEDGGHACAPAAVDLLLPLAERKFSDALVLLAYAHEFGRGVKRDARAAAALLAAAEQRTGRDAVLGLAMMECEAGPRECPTRVTREPFERLVAAGEPLAQFLLAMRQIAAKKHLDAPSLAALRASAEAGLPMAQSLYGGYLVDQKDYAGARRWLEKAAAHDEPGALKQLASMHQHGLGGPVESEAALALQRRAASAGDVPAMLAMAAHYETLHDRIDPDDSGRPAWLQDVEWRGPALQAADYRDARAAWLSGAANAGHVESAFELAAMYADDEAPLEGGRDEAIAIYKQLSARGHVRARIELARLQRLDDGTAASLQAARELLGADAAAGHVEARRELGLVLGNMTGKPALQKEGRDLLRRASDAGDVAATLYYASMLARGMGGPPDAKQARKRWRSVEDVNANALNDRAWHECTAPARPMFDAASGAAAARRLRAGRPAPAHLDTIAACEAANGDFAAAQRTQQQAIDAVSALGEAAAQDLQGMRQRLALYARGERYIEKP